MRAPCYTQLLCCSSLPKPKLNSNLKTVILWICLYKSHSFFIEQSSKARGSRLYFVTHVLLQNRRDSKGANFPHSPLPSPTPYKYAGIGYVTV